VIGIEWGNRRWHRNLAKSCISYRSLI